MYVAVALKDWKRKISGMETDIVDICLFTLNLADDQVIVANDREDIQYRKQSVTVNLNRIKYLCVGAKSSKLELDYSQETIAGGIFIQKKTF